MWPQLKKFLSRSAAAGRLVFSAIPLHDEVTAWSPHVMWPGHSVSFPFSFAGVSRWVFGPLHLAPVFMCGTVAVISYALSVCLSARGWPRSSNTTAPSSDKPSRQWRILPTLVYPTCLFFITLNFHFAQPHSELKIEQRLLWRTVGLAVSVLVQALIHTKLRPLSCLALHSAQFSTGPIAA